MTVDTSEALKAALWMASHDYQLWPCRVKLKLKEDGTLEKDVTGLPKKWTHGGLTNLDDIKA
jgi:hypothetical protein